MRLSEMASLKLDQIDFDLKIILVHGKGNKDRYVPFGKDAANALKSIAMMFDLCYLAKMTIAVMYF